MLCTWCLNSNGHCTDRPDEFPCPVAEDVGNSIVGQPFCLGPVAHVCVERADYCLLNKYIFGVRDERVRISRGYLYSRRTAGIPTRSVSPAGPLFLTVRFCCHRTGEASLFVGHVGVPLLACPCAGNVTLSSAAVLRQRDCRPVAKLALILGGRTMDHPKERDSGSLPGSASHWHHNSQRTGPRERGLCRNALSRVRYNGTRPRYRASS